MAWSSLLLSGVGGMLMVSMIFDGARFVVVVDDNFLLSILELAGAF